MGDQSAYMPSPGTMPKKSGGGGGGGGAVSFNLSILTTLINHQQSSFIFSLFVAAATSSSSRQAQHLRLATMRRHRLVETSRPTCELLGRGKLRDRNLKK